MAWRGAIALSRGLSLAKAKEDKKKEKVKKWEDAIKRQKQSHPVRRDISLDMEPAHHHTHEGLIRLHSTMSANGRTGAAQRQLFQKGGSQEYSVAELNRMNTWQHRGAHNEVVETSFSSDRLSSSLELHRSPSNGFEDYQNRRAHFFARMVQPQDGDGSEQNNSFGGNSSQRKLVQQYEERKRQTQNQEQVLRERIRLEMKRFHDTPKIGAQDEVHTAGVQQLEIQSGPSTIPSNLTNRSPRRSLCKCRLKQTVMRVTVPLRGQLSLGQALLILIVNLIVPGIGTALLAFAFNERLYMSDTALALVEKGEFKQEFYTLIKQKIRRHRQFVVSVGAAQLFSVCLFLFGWLWALATSFSLVRDAYLYRKQGR